MKLSKEDLCKTCTELNGKKCKVPDEDEKASWSGFDPDTGESIMAVCSRHNKKSVGDNDE